MIERTRESMHVVETELRHYQSTLLPVPDIYVDPILSYQRKRTILETSAAGTRDQYNAPDWTLRMVRSRQHAGYFRVFALI